MEPSPAALAAGAHEAVLAARAESQVLRLLGGAGRPSLFGYAPGPTGSCEALYHGLSADGHLLVAAIDTFDNPVLAVPDLTGVNVRLDVVKEAPEWNARVTACAIHLLGRLEWLPRHAAEIAEGNPLLAEVASLPGGRLGVIHTDRVVLHDSAGVSVHEFGAVAPHHASAFPKAAEELDAREALTGLSSAELAGLFRAAEAGWGGAIALSSRVQATCHTLHGRVLCVDLDAAGVTLMQVDAAGTRTVFFPFSTAVGSLPQLREQIGALRTASRTQQRLPQH